MAAISEKALEEALEEALEKALEKEIERRGIKSAPTGVP